MSCDIFILGRQMLFCVKYLDSLLLYLACVIVKILVAKTSIYIITDLEK